MKLSPILSKAADIRAKEDLTDFHANTRKEYIDELWRRHDLKIAHNRPDGSSFSTILNDIGWNDDAYTRGLAENMDNGTNKYSSKKFVENWYNSPGHRRNMLNPDWEYMGYGVSTEKPFELSVAVQLFS